MAQATFPGSSFAGVTRDLESMPYSLMVGCNSPGEGSPPKHITFEPQGDAMNRDSPLGGQVALVTGASRGIGLAIARRLGLMGARVALCARNTAPLEKAASDLRSTGIEVLAAPADVTRAELVSSLVGETQRVFGPVDILVNNAGVGIFGPFYQQT